MDIAGHFNLVSIVGIISTFIAHLLQIYFVYSNYIMAFTRFHDDPARIEKRLQQMTDPGRWVIDVPGNGTKPQFMLDPHIIPQKWGANLWSNFTDVQSSLLGMNKRLNRDCIDQNIYKRENILAHPIDYPVCDEFITTEQSRAIMPAWTARDLPQNHAYILDKNPQEHTEIPYNSYVNTRLAEKDNFNRVTDCIPSIPLNSQEYTLPSNIYNTPVKKSIRRH